MNFFGEEVSRAWIRQESPMVLRSGAFCASDSPNSDSASRPSRNSAPVSGARTLSPEQSAK